MNPEDHVKANLNIREDFSQGKARMEETQLATFNLLEDFCEEKSRLEETQSAMLNLLQDFEAERSKAEDVSGELRESVELLRRAKEVAEASNRELDAFSYSVSHDLRAPLRHIAGFSGILMEEYGGKLDPPAQRYLQQIQEGTRRMGQLVDDLLNLARVGRHELRLQVTSLESVVKAVIDDLTLDIEGRAVEWKISSLPYVEWDPSLLKQVFQNLLSNALKYSRPRSPAIIEIGQTTENGQTVVFVRDNGVGFNMKYADKLFGVFQRLHRPGDFEGTGIGLATVQRIVRKHGGKIWAEAEPDLGATFYLTLDGSRETEVKTLAAQAGQR